MSMEFSGVCRHTPSCDGILADGPDNPVCGVCQRSNVHWEVDR